MADGPSATAIWSRVANVQPPLAHVDGTVVSCRPGLTRNPRPSDNGRSLPILGTPTRRPA